MIITGGFGRSARKVASQRRSGSHSPACASSIIFWATASRVGLAVASVCSSATSDISKAMPIRRIVSGSKRCPSKYDLIGMAAKNLIRTFCLQRGNVRRFTGFIVGVLS